MRAIMREVLIMNFGGISNVLGANVQGHDGCILERGRRRLDQICWAASLRRSHTARRSAGVFPSRSVERTVAGRAHAQVVRSR